MAINTRAYIERYIKIRDKGGQIVPLRLNAPQLKLYDAIAAQHRAGKPMRAIVLKARQMGFSTLVEAMLFKRTVTARGTKSGIVAHKDDATNNLYKMSRLMLEQLPEELQPARKATNARELIFDTRDGKGLGSSIRVMTAGGAGIGRSDTFQNLHISEFAFWPGDKRLTLAGAMQAVPDRPGTMVIIESTANGFDEFKQMWDRAVAGESEFVPVFCAWWELEEYRREPEEGVQWTDEERALCARYGLDDWQLAWRRWCIENNCAGDLDLFRQEYPACPEEAFLSTGECIFDAERIAERLGQLPEPVRRVRPVYDITIQSGREVLVPGGAEDDRRGSVAVYEEPQAGVPYVIGADTAGEGSDWFVAQVLDNRDGRQVAVLRRQYDEDAFACELMALGYWYNTALLGIEANFSTYPIKTCERLGYPLQYTREEEDSYTHRLQRRWGVKTTSRTRPLMLAELVRVVREETGGINDETTLREMLTFVRNERGRPEAMEGEHDDCVMALAIAHYIRGQQSRVAEPVRGGAAGGGPVMASEYDRQVESFLEF